MKIGIIADIHSNIYGLKSVLEEIKDADIILCAGDITGYYTFVNEVFDEIRKRKTKLILGNHDAYLLGIIPVSKDPIIRKPLEYTKKNITPENLRYLRGIDSPSLGLEIDGIKIKMYHGSPWDEFEEYIYPNHSNFERFKKINADLIILGHTHWPMVKKIGVRTIVNPGSCGQPRDNDRRASFAIFDTKTKEILIERVDYDVTKVCQAVERERFNYKLIQILKK